MTNSSRTIAFLLFEGFEIIDHAGPSSVFAAANAASDGRVHYQQAMYSAQGGVIEAASGLQIMTRPVSQSATAQIDTLFVVGSNGPALERAFRETELVDGLKALMKVSDRVASVCSGAFILAATGALNGKTATTHWAGRERFAATFPKVRVTNDDLYVNDGHIWTAGGATAGIDMALAMLRADHGPSVVRTVARRLLVYAHRPGNQSQFSALLDTQTSISNRFSDIVGWLNSAPLEGVNVPFLAEKARMTERTFYRKFTQETGLTPARYLERVRLARAKSMLDDGQPVSSVAANVGFRSQSGFRASFESQFGMSPSVYRALQSKTEGSLIAVT